MHYLGFHLLHCGQVHSGHLQGVFSQSHPQPQAADREPELNKVNKSFFITYYLSDKVGYNFNYALESLLSCQQIKYHLQKILRTWVL